tara:strand:- start:344 stop:1285 length:942 start_codon:yes stop_codon:yes gene_type:complete
MEKNKTIEEVLNFVWDNGLFSGYLDKNAISEEFSIETKNKYPSIDEQLIILSNCICTSVEYLYQQLGWSLTENDELDNMIYPLIKSEKRWWGNIGILLPNEDKSRWYPLRSDQGLLDSLSQVKSQLIIKEYKNIFLIITSSNRLLIINKNNIKKISFLEEGADQPSNDWDGFRNKFDLQGELCIPYMRMIYNSYYGNEMPLTNIQKEIKEEMLNVFFDSSMNWDYEYKDLEQDEIMDRFFNEVSIHFNDGSKDYKTMGDWTLNLYQNLINGSFSEFIDISDDGFFEKIPISTISLIEVPLINLIDCIKNNLQD